MTIDMELSTKSIEKAIEQLKELTENLLLDAGEAVDVLCREGADTANEAYGKMAAATPYRDKDGLEDGIAEGHIGVSGRTDDAAIIAEFGAGYATMENHPLAGRAPVPVRIGSYSEAHDGMFYQTDAENPGEGYWVFGGVPMDRVQPRHGLLDAREELLRRGAEIAKEVMKLD